MTASLLPSARHPALRIAGWFAAGVVLVVFLAFASLKAPVQIKLLGWFGIGMGALAGYLLGSLAKQLQAPGGRIIYALAFLLILGGQTLAAAEAYRVRTKWLLAHFQKDPLSGAEAQRVSAEKQVDAAADATLEASAGPALPQVPPEELERARQELLSVDRFFAERLMLVNWEPLDAIHNRPWPAVLWGLEVLLAASVGTWCTARVLRPNPSGPAANSPPELASRPELH